MKTKIIAEAGSNHNGDIEIAKEVIKAAAKIGADYIEFQSWQNKNLKKDHLDIEYYRLRELSDEDHFVLINESKKHNIKILTSCSVIKK
jgi:sialic acid synthase SpsE